MKRYSDYLRRFFMMKFAMLVLVLSLCVFPLNAYAGGGSGPNGPSDGSDNTSLETGLWVALMVVLIGGLIYSFKDKELVAQFNIDSPEVDKTNEDLVSSNNLKKLVTTEGELIVHHW